MIAKRRSWWPALALLVVLGIATACGGSGSSADGAATDNSEQQESAGGQEAPGAEDSERSTNEGSGEGSEKGSGDQKSSNRSRPSIDNRTIIRTGTMSIRTKQPERAADQAERLIEGSDGFVGERTKDNYPGDDRTRVALTLRVPVDRFDATRKAISEVGKVTEDRHEATDVTDEVVDVESRIENQKHSIDRLRSLMADADDIGEIIQIESKLQTRESDLESLQARQESLSSQANLSTLTATFTEPSPKGDDSDDPQLGFLTGLRGGTDALVATGAVTLTAIGAAAPFLPLLLLLGAGIWWVRRRLGGRTIGRQTENARVGPGHP